jgi:hypothetical protein
MLFFFIRLFQMEPRLRREHLRFTPSRAQSEACQELLAALESTAADPGTTSCDHSISSHTEMVSRLVAVGRDMGLARWPRDSGSRLVLPDSQVEDEESHMDPCIIGESSSDQATDVTDEGEAPDEISSTSSIKGNSRYAELEAGDEAFPSSLAALAALPTFLRSGELIPNDGGSSFASDDLDDAVGKSPCHLCTEFLSVECYNGPSTSRGIYIHGGSIVYVTRHSKARRMTNQEFQVARYLPKEDSNLVATYLALIRPFADMLNRACFGYDKERRLMFASPDKVDKHWQSDVLISALSNLTQELSPQPFGVQIYRQLSIVATERYVKEISRPFDLNDGKSAAADIEVVCAWKIGHRPMQPGTSYGIDAAYPDSLQPALLRVYRWVSCRWHEFLEKPQKLLEVADLDTPEPARQCGIALKRCSHSAGDAPEPKRCRMSDVPKNNIARSMRASGFLASALFWEDRHDSTTEQE